MNRDCSTGLLAEVVNGSDVCPGCNRVYATSPKRDPITDRWAWRLCPTPGCVHHGRTVAYPLDWEVRARDRIRQLEAALGAVREVARCCPHPPTFERIADFVDAGLHEGDLCPACEAMPTGADGRAAFCSLHREGSPRSSDNGGFQVGDLVVQDCTMPYPNVVYRVVDVRPDRGGGFRGVPVFRLCEGFPQKRTTWFAAEAFRKLEQGELSRLVARLSSMLRV